MITVVSCSLCGAILTNEDKDVAKVWIPPDPEEVRRFCHKECAEFFEESRPDEETRKRRYKEKQSEPKKRFQVDGFSRTSDSDDSCN